MGSPELVRCSHNEGMLNFVDNTGKYTEIEQFNIYDKDMPNADIVTLDAQCGDLIIYHMNLIHRSGFNYSNKVRFSAIARAFKTMTSKFNPFSSETLLI